MNKELTIEDKLKEKYHKCEEVTNFKEMLNRSASIFRTRTAFKLKDDKGNIYNKTYEELKNDVAALGTSLIENGLLNKRIAVIGKNSYKWAISYLAASIVGVVVPIDKELHSDDVINFMNVSESKCILGDNKNLKKINENIEKLENKETLFIDFDSKIQEGNSLSFEVQMENGKTLVEEGNAEFDKIIVNPLAETTEQKEQYETQNLTKYKYIPMKCVFYYLHQEQQEMQKGYVFHKEISAQISCQYMEL